MTRFRELLRDVADQAEPIDDLAGQALRPRTARLRMPIAFAAAVSVAVVLSLTVTGVRLLDDGAGPRQVDTVTTTGGVTTVRFPETAPPLPDEGVDSVLLSYQMPCKDADGNRRDCDTWRVLTTDGQHYEVEGPVVLHDPPGSGLLVSPDGKRIAYLDQDGAFVLRELESGETTTLFEWEPEAVYADVQEGYSWSPDGRWLLVAPGEEACVPEDEDDEEGLCRNHLLDDRPMLVDTETGEALPLGDGSESTYGLPNGDRPFPFDGVAGAGDGLPLVDHDGEIVDELPNRVLPGQKVDGKLGNISPDGRTLAVMTFPKDKPSDPDGGGPLITIVDVENERIVDSFPIERSWEVWDYPDLLGWRDDSTMLIATHYLKGSIPLGPGDSVPMNVDAFDVRTGDMHRVLRLPDRPSAVNVASSLL